MPAVLVVDDDAHIREVARFALARAGHAVGVDCANGITAFWLELPRSRT